MQPALSVAFTKEPKDQMAGHVEAMNAMTENKFNSMEHAMNAQNIQELKMIIDDAEQIFVPLNKLS